MGPPYLSLCLMLSVGAYDVILTTNYGQIGGFKYTTSSNTTSDIILNIPYAEPPLGELRFEKPRLPQNWTTIRDGTDFGFQCIPHAQVAILNPAIYGNISEDCLTLNVMRPSTTPPADGWPIMVWIHGGGFEIGSQPLYGYKGIANVFNPKGIMMISIQYRLGIYGFLTSGEDDVFPGNYGLFDQALAVRFIYENAALWNGNPKSITLLGHSAAAATVGQLSVSPYSRQYVKGTVHVSGSMNGFYGRGIAVPNFCKQLMEAMNCPTSGLAAKECMRTKSSTEIFAAVNTTGYYGFDYHYLKYGPRLDGDFFPKDPMDMIRDNPPAPAIIGVGNRDAAYFTYMGYAPSTQPFAIPPDTWLNFTSVSLVDQIKQKFIKPEVYGSQTPLALTSAIFEYVIKNFRDSYDYFLLQYQKIVGDTQFYVAAYDEAQVRMDAGSDVYLYRFDHYNEAIFPNNLTTQIMKGSPHTNEYNYLFEMTVFPKFDTNTADETIVKETFQDVIISFAKNGIPTSNHVTWPKANKNDMNFLKIDKNPQMLNGFYEEEARFWHEMRAFGYDLITDLPTTTAVESTTNLDTAQVHEQHISSSLSSVSSLEGSY